MVIVTGFTAEPDRRNSRAFRGATTRSRGPPEGLSTPTFGAVIVISALTDYYHGLLEVGETRTLNPTLKLGSVSSNVTVVDATPDLNLTNAEVGGVITGSQTEELPVNGRYWASLEALIPGAISAGTGTQDQIRFQRPLAGGQQLSLRRRGCHRSQSRICESGDAPPVSVGVHRRV